MNVMRGVGYTTPRPIGLSTSKVLPTALHYGYAPYRRPANTHSHVYSAVDGPPRLALSMRTLHRINHT